jgi:hypothetical protein
MMLELRRGFGLPANAPIPLMSVLEVVRRGISDTRPKDDPVTPSMMLEATRRGLTMVSGDKVPKGVALEALEHGQHPHSDLPLRADQLLESLRQGLDMQGISLSPSDLLGVIQRGFAVHGQGPLSPAAASAALRQALGLEPR